MSVWLDIHKQSTGDTERKEDFLEMEYRKGYIDINTPFFEILTKKTYKNMTYVCMSRGSHPCTYVFCDKDFLDRHTDNWGNLDCISVHGGVTFTGQANTLVGLSDYPDDKYCFGWDYAHAGDWDGNHTDYENAGSHKYTSQDLINECMSAIDQYLEVLEIDSKTM